MTARDIAVLILLGALAFDDIGVFQPHFLAHSQAEIFVIRGDFHEVLLLDIQLSGEGDLVRRLAARRSSAVIISVLPSG